MTVPGSANPLLLKSAGSSQYLVERSLRFSSSDSAFCSRTPASAGNRKTFTWAGWVKRSNLGGAGPALFGCQVGSGNPRDGLSFTADQLEYSANTTGSAWNVSVKTTQVFRDASAWYHIVLAVDTTQATAANRVRLYVNGSEVTAFTTATYPAQNTDLPINQAQIHYLGASTGGNYFDGLLADVFFIDGQQLTPSSFTEVSATTGQLIPKAYTGSFGTNGFWLKFSDNSAATATTLGKDYSGNSNNWTPNNLSVTAGAGNDSLVDTPSSAGTDTGLGGQVTGNYATFNPFHSGSGVTLSNGNLDASTGGSNVNRAAYSTIAFDASGKYYFEFTCQSTNIACGIIRADSVATNAYCGETAAGYSYYGPDGKKYNNNVGSTYGATFTTGDVIGVAIDSGTLTFYKNGVSQGAAYSGLSGQYLAGFGGYSNTISANFGQRPFAYPVSGFKALCDTNLPSPLIAKPSTVMDVALYTGNGTNRNITGFGFSPDLVWIKSRSSGTLSHALFDTVRGVNLGLQSNATTAETSDSVSLTAFNSDGFGLGTGNTYFGVNTNSATFVAWAFDAGSSTVSNTAGSITSSVRANASAGFSIVTWTGTGSGSATIGHGLGVKPTFIVVKPRSATLPWYVQHGSLGAGQIAYLNATDAFGPTTGGWNSTEPTSTVFTVGYALNTANTYVAYCFAPVTGYSSFGSYTGNGSSDGPFVYTGFRPRWVMVKCSSAGGDSQNWVVHDTARDTSNVMKSILLPNLSNAELTTSASDGYYVDTLSNGFKIRTVNGNWNTSAATYVWAAFAESPFQYARAR